MNSYDYEDKDPETSFMEGFDDEMEVEECAECGSALREETFSKAFNGESLGFCNQDCAKDYKDSV